MLDFINRFFRRDESSKSMAKERLRLVLMSDRVALAPETFDAMKGEMLGVLQRYLEIDEHGLDVHFENAERRFMLLANIPVTQVKTHEQIEQERRRIAVNGNGTDATETRPRRRRRRRRAAANGTSAGTSLGTPENADAIAPTDDDAPNASAGANGALNGHRSAPSEPESGPGLPNGDENQES
ncbi:MAG TPA: cell division topological specificity factor MinE [Candidatus Eremiobacteraceae bacterium]|nr:cell division topological specificity factor MinE [Candidatus Eremiobacteraceae bacterium]